MCVAARLARRAALPLSVRATRWLTPSMMARASLTDHALLPMRSSRSAALPPEGLAGAPSPVAAGRAAACAARRIGLSVSTSGASSAAALSPTAVEAARAGFRGGAAGDERFAIASAAVAVAPAAGLGSANLAGAGPAPGARSLAAAVAVAAPALPDESARPLGRARRPEPRSERDDALAGAVAPAGGVSARRESGDSRALDSKEPRRSTALRASPAGREAAASASAAARAAAAALASRSASDWSPAVRGPLAESGRNPRRDAALPPSGSGPAAAPLCQRGDVRASDRMELRRITCMRAAFSTGTAAAAVAGLAGALVAAADGGLASALRPAALLGPRPADLPRPRACAPSGDSTDHRPLPAPAVAPSSPRPACLPAGLACSAATVITASDALSGPASSVSGRASASRCMTTARTSADARRLRNTSDASGMPAVTTHTTAMANTLARTCAPVPQGTKGLVAITRPVTPAGAPASPASTQLSTPTAVLVPNT
mmetsp:Transcript_16582/g.62745  ORF Transcript_16582/g.62745 Transcript_16582/m.62745 type:complete len:491 (+) Transcript_16582:1335-2807(+)